MDYLEEAVVLARIDRICRYLHLAFCAVLIVLYVTVIPHSSPHEHVEDRGGAMVPWPILLLMYLLLLSVPLMLISLVSCTGTILSIVITEHLLRQSKLEHLARRYFWKDVRRYNIYTPFILYAIFSGISCEFVFVSRMLE